MTGGTASEGKPKLRLEKTVSKSVSSERGNALVHITFSSHVPEFGMVKLARPWSLNAGISNPKRRLPARPGARAKT
jgi:hypothetical protein